MCLLNAMHLKNHLQNNCIKYLFLFRIPVPLRGPQSFWLGGPQSFSQQSAKDTGYAQSPYHNHFNILVYNSWSVHSAILPGVTGLLHLRCTAQTHALKCLRAFRFVRERAGGDALAVTRTVSALVQEQCRKNLSDVGFIFNWRSYQGGVCYVFQGYPSPSHHVRNMNRLHDGGSGEPQHLSF